MEMARHHDCARVRIIHAYLHRGLLKVAEVLTVARRVAGHKGRVVGGSAGALADAYGASDGVRTADRAPKEAWAAAAVVVPENVFGRVRPFHEKIHFFLCSFFMVLFYLLCSSFKLLILLLLRGYNLGAKMLRKEEEWRGRIQ
jgi:hypothetical protein